MPAGGARPVHRRRPPRSRAAEVSAFGASPARCPQPADRPRARPRRRWRRCCGAPGRHDHRAGWSRQVDARPGARATRCSPTASTSADSVDVVFAELARSATRPTRSPERSPRRSGWRARRPSGPPRWPRRSATAAGCCSSSTTASTCSTPARLSSTRSSTPATRARVLVTSREPLRVDGEAVHALGSLGSSAVELFVERANAAAGADVARPDDPAGRLLCERLDGLPLAIELAAAQLRHLSLDRAGRPARRPARRCWRANASRRCPALGARGDHRLELPPALRPRPATSSTGSASSPRRSTWTRSIAVYGGRDARRGDERRRRPRREEPRRA